MIAISALRARIINIPFVRSFKQATHTRVSSESMVVEAWSAEGLVGYGECLPRDYVGGASLATTLAALRALTSRSAGAPFASAADIALLLGDAGPDAAANNARCALELACLDLLGKTLSQTALQLLGAPRRDLVTYTGVVPAEEPPGIVAVASRMRAAGLTAFKLKVGADAAADRENLSALRDAVGSAAEIRVDANGSWDLEEALRRLRDYAERGVAAVEQPLPPSLDSDLPALRRAAGGVAIVADESVIGAGDVRRLAAAGAVDGINVKIAKVGGIGPALSLHHEAREHGVFCQLGAHVGETSLATAAGVIFAALAGDLRWHEGAFGLHLLEYDVGKASLQFGAGGHISLLARDQAAGLGIAVDPSTLDRCTQEVFDLIP